MPGKPDDEMFAKLDRHLTVSLDIKIQTMFSIHKLIGRINDYIGMTEPTIFLSVIHLISCLVVGHEHIHVLTRLSSWNAVDW